MAEDIDYLRQLISESRGLPKDDSVSLGDRAWNAWSVWTKKPKSADRMDADRRAAYVLSRLTEKYPRVWTHEEIPEHIRDAASLYQKDPSLWTSAYETREGDYPIYHAAKWAQSLPSALYSTAKMVGNEAHKAFAEDDTVAKHVPYPEAYGDYEYAVNTLTGGLSEGTILPKSRSYWHDVSGVPMQQARKGQVGLYPSDARDSQVASKAHAAMQQLEEGEQYLTRAGAHPAVAKAVGPVMDAALSVPSSIGPAVNALRAGKPAAALMDMGVDYALSTPHLWLPAISKATQGKLPWEE